MHWGTWAVADNETGIGDLAAGFPLSFWTLSHAMKVDPASETNLVTVRVHYTFLQTEQTCVSR